MSVDDMYIESDKAFDVAQKERDRGYQACYDWAPMDQSKSVLWKEGYRQALRARLGSTYQPNSRYGF
ncbi:hypothetical protein D3C75_946020 [compost metagenome]